MFFKINCYVQSINATSNETSNKTSNEMIIYINDSIELNRFQQNLIKLYKNPDSFDYEKKIFKIKLLPSTKFNLRFKYENLKSLVGTNIYISGYSKYYCFSVDSEVFDELTNLFKPIKKIIKGYTLYASKIYN